MAAATSRSVPKRPSGIMRLHFVFQFLRERVGHGRNDEAGRDGVHRDVARGDFDGDGAGEADQPGLGGDVIGWPALPVSATTEVILMIRPERCWSIAPRACWMQRCAPVRLVRSTASQSSSFMRRAKRRA